MVGSGASDGEIAAIKLQQLAVQLQRDHAAQQPLVAVSSSNAVGGSTGAFQQHPLLKPPQLQPQELAPSPNQAPSVAHAQAAPQTANSSLQPEPPQHWLPIRNQRLWAPPHDCASHVTGNTIQQQVQQLHHQPQQFQQHQALWQHPQQQPLHHAQFQMQHPAQPYASGPSGGFNYATFPSGVTNSYSYKTAFPFPSGAAATSSTETQAIGGNPPAMLQDDRAHGGPNLAGILQQVPQQQPPPQYHQHLQPPYYQQYHQYNYSQPQPGVMHMPPQPGSMQLSLIQEQLRQAQFAGGVPPACTAMPLPCGAPSSVSHPLRPPGTYNATAALGPVRTATTQSCDPHLLMHSSPFQAVW